MINKVSNYDKHPFIPVEGFEDDCWQGWEAIGEKLKKELHPVAGKKKVVAVESYIGVNQEEVLSALIRALRPVYTCLASDAYKCTAEIDKMVYPDVTDDRIFGYLSRLRINDFFDKSRLATIRNNIHNVEEEGVILLYGMGATLLAPADILVYADMPRWEGQLRFRRNEANNLGSENKNAETAIQYKRAYFVDWRVCDRLKKTLINKWDYVLDTVITQQPKMVSGEAVRAGLRQAVTQPFRVVPFFDPGPWGGQWMKEVCDLDRSVINYAWCFDCVPEENSLLLEFGDLRFEIPASNLVFYQPKELLGAPVHARFGDEFPIRFDFLDTMEGGNLSLQVHPLTEYIQEYFGMPYTQDESYYMLDAAEDACVYLGLKENTQPALMMQELRESEVTGHFDAEAYVEKWPVKKHDHILIPAGTVHCSGTNCMVLEVSATPYIFTFKLWDWGRMGLDGKPRPIYINHGESNIQWGRTASWTKENLLNRVEKIAEGEGWMEERTGLHENEFIETRRHWFTQPVLHNTGGIVNVINLVDGREAIVESPTGAFSPFIVHYAETFIVPAQVGAYRISPYGESEDKLCATLKAYVRTKA
ncbi:MAG: class I mannose-6-phosphate isomerase [Chitinophagaceae bacterium]